MATINVPGDKSTIQKAINSAGSGDTIKISDSGGPYNESVTIDEPNGLTLEGVNNPTIKGDGVNSGSQPHATIHVDDGSGPVRNVTIDGKDRLTVRNPDGKFGIFAGTGSTNKDPDGIDGLKITNTTVKDISTNSSGGSLTGGPAGIGIRGDYGTDGNPGIEISNNTIDNVENTGGGPEPVGITLKSFTGDAGFGFDSNGNEVTDSASPPATDTDILNNDISNITSSGGFATKGISVSGEFEDVDIIGNQLDTIESPGGDARAITLSENGGSYEKNQYDIDGDGHGERIGPQDFDIKNNTISNVNAADARSINFGGYEKFGDHSVSQNTINDGAVTRFAGDQPGFQPGGGDALNLSNNTFNDQGPGTYVSDPSENADLDSVLANNTFNRGVAAGKRAIFGTIQAAVDNANSGETIKLSDGTHNGSTTIETSGLTIKPAGGASPTLVGDGESVGSQPHATIHVDDGSGPVRNVTIDGKNRLTVRNPDGKFGIFAGTGTTNPDPDGIGGLKIINTTVKDISTNSSGGSLTGGPAGIGIRGDYGTDGNPGIDIGKSGKGNVIKNVQSGGFTNAVGITLKSFTGDAGFGFDSSGSSVTDSSSPPATDTDIVDNDISNIDGGDKSRTKGISVSGEFEDVLVEGNSITDITAADDGSDGDALAITFTENGGSYSGNEYDIDNDGNGERIGPRDFEIRNNDIETLTADSTNAIFVGGYEDLNGGGTHVINGNTIKDGTVERFAGSQPGFQSGDEDALNLSSNTFNDQGPGTYVSDPSQSANLDSVLANNTFKRGVAVGKRAIFGTIQTAVGNANSGETIEVSAGTFNEEVSIGKNITLTEADDNTSTPTISGQVRITGAVGGSNTLEVSDLDIDYDSRVVSNSGNAKSAVFFEQTEKKKNITIRDNTITGPEDGDDGFVVYKRKSRGDPDDDITFENNIFDAGSSGVNQLVVIKAANHDSSNEINIIDNIFSGDVNRNNISDTEKGSALDHRADDGEIKNNNFDGGQNLSKVTGPEPLASATGANTSIRHNNGGNSGLVLEGDSEAGNDIQTVLDESDSNEIVRITDEAQDDQTFNIAQNGSSSNQNQIEINAENVTLEGSGSGTDEIQVPDSRPAIEISGNNKVDIKNIGITNSSSGGDTGIVISGSSSNCTVRDNTITVNPNAAIEIDGGSNNVIEDNRLKTASGGGAGVLVNSTGGSGNLIALNDIDSAFDYGIDIEDPSSANASNVTVRFNNLRGNNAGIRNKDGENVDARSNFWNDKTGPSGGVDDPETGRTADGDGSAIDNGSNGGQVRYDEFLEISNEFILNTGSPPSGRDTDGDDLHEDFNDDSDHFPTDGYLFLRALRQGHFDRLAAIDNPGGDLSENYTESFDFDGDGADDITRDDVNEMVISRNR